MVTSNFEFDQVPKKEDEYYEFKSSRTANNTDEFAKKLSKAISGFANSGGGFFIVGLDEDSGLVDGGIPQFVKSKPLNDWVDQIVHQISPTPKYSVILSEDIYGRGTLIKGNVVLVVAVEESYTGPHMYDHKYYIRAGAHTEPAKHFIVEAIRAKRYHSKPKLTYLFRLKPNREKILQLGILSLTDAPAMDVYIQLSPVPESLKVRENDFPIKVSVIDQRNPFFFDVSLFSGSDTAFGNEIILTIAYKDLLNIEYNYEIVIGVNNSTQPIVIGNDYQEKISKTLEEIKNNINKYNQNKRFESPYTPVIYNNKDLFGYVKSLLPELIDEMRVDLVEHPFKREFILFGKNWIYNGDKNNEVLMYFFEDHHDLRGKVRILENYGFVYNISFNDTDRFAITEQFIQRLTL